MQRNSIITYMEEFSLGKMYFKENYGPLKFVKLNYLKVQASMGLP